MDTRRGRRQPTAPLAAAVGAVAKRTMRTRGGWLSLALVVGLAATTARAEGPVNAAFINRVVEGLGFQLGDEARVRAGEIISQAQDEAEDELGAALALVVHRPVAVVYQAVRDNELAGGAGEHRIDPADPDSALAVLPIPDSLVSELRAARPGGSLHLSAAEIETLRDTPDTGLADAYRALLADRVREYIRAGFAGIAPYARRRGVSDPGARLAAAAERLRLVRDASVSMDDALRSFPIVSGDAVEHQFWWEMNEVEGKPTPTLLHRILHTDGDHAFIAGREFYVARSYNALHVFVGLFTMEPADTLVLYLNRTFTDQVAGVGSGVRHRIGRGMLVDEVSAMLAEARTELEQR